MSLQMSLKVKITIAAAFVSAALVLVFLPSGIRMFKQTEDETCRKTCSARGLSGVLIPVVKSAVVSGKYDGPWQCECR